MAAPLQFEPLHIPRGMLMGAADVVPGVSGGTVALVLGVYERLVIAITRFDRELLRLVRTGQWRQAAEHLDLLFLVSLGAGIVTGIGLLAGLMHYLLEHHRAATLSAFFGTIAASSLLVGRLVPRWRGLEVVCLLAGGSFAFWLVRQSALTHPPEGVAYLFLCGAVAISAMILPGISGAFILVLLGKYRDLLGTVKDLVHLQVTPEGVITLAVFGLGCLVGLLSFARLLKWLLGQHGSATMAVLCGFMVGSLYKLWPFERYAAPEGVSEFSDRYFVKLGWSELPAGGELALCAGICVLAAGGVLLLDRLTRGKFEPEDSAAESEK